MSTRKIKLIVQYDGFDYCGWQIQPGERTVQGELSRAVSELVDWKITVHGASRTDAGVSALGQSAVFEVVDCRIPTENFQKAINDRLPDDIVVTEVTDADDKFDVIGGVTSKLYRYTIYTGKIRPVFDVRHCWHIPSKLDVDAMNTAAQFLVGKHDFKSFASAKDNRQSSIRTIFRCDVTSRDEWIYIDVEGDGFLYNMVRNIVGSLVEVGTGRWQPEKIKEVLEMTDRTAAGPIAPPQGLCLMNIEY
jgi:tRNA pseudouridine38-40 synthase